MRFIIGLILVMVLVFGITTSGVSHETLYGPTYSTTYKGDVLDADWIPIDMIGLIDSVEFIPSDLVLQ